MTIKSFRRASASIPRFGAKKIVPKKRFDGSARERGYDSVWAKLSKRYRKAARGLCEECERRGVIKTCDVVDHMIPLKDAPEHRLNWSNLDALCHKCHNGLKRRIEQYAEKTGQLSQIPQWMKYPDSRPIHFQFDRAEGFIKDDVAYNRSKDCEVNEATPALIDVRDCPCNIFDGPGSLVSASNHSSCRIEVVDGLDPVQILEDGSNLMHPIVITKGLRIHAPHSGAGKISLAYVKNRQD